MRHHLITILAMLGAFATQLSADDAYVFRFIANGGSVGCATVQWADDILLFNNNTAAATVRLLSLSNADIPPSTPLAVGIAPQQALSLNRATRNAPWRPGGPGGLSPLTVAHLDVPRGVTIDSRDEFFAINGPCTVEDPFRVSLGKLSLPVYRTLQPAGKPRIFLGSDLGGRHNIRVNVVIFNAGTMPATAHLELRRVCDDSIDDQQTIIVPPNTALQYGSLHKGQDICNDPLTPEYLRYTVVTVDQPSLSYISVLGAADAQDNPGIAPTVELAVPLNTEQ